jgi:hypothetical protein
MLLHKVLCDIEALAGCATASIRESEEWAAVVRSAEDNREGFCKTLRGKPLFSALYGTYTVTQNELKTVLKAQPGQTKQANGFQEVRSRKRHSTGEAASTPKKATVAPTAAKVTTSNYFAPLRAAHMDTSAPAEPTAKDAAAPVKSTRPPPIVLTTAQTISSCRRS